MTDGSVKEGARNTIVLLLWIAAISVLTAMLFILLTGSIRTAFGLGGTEWTSLYASFMTRMIFVLPLIPITFLRGYSRDPRYRLALDVVYYTVMIASILLMSSNISYHSNGTSLIVSDVFSESSDAYFDVITVGAIVCVIPLMKLLNIVWPSLKKKENDYD